MATKQRLHSIEAIPKRVFLSGAFRVNIPKSHAPLVLGAVYDLGRAIENGYELEERFYRKNRLTTTDELLNRTGIMHLHPVGHSTSYLLFLVQYVEYVLFLEASDHSHFQILPPGHLLMKVHKEALAAQEQAYAEFVRKRQDAWERSGSS